MPTDSRPVVLEGKLVFDHGEDGYFCRVGGRNLNNCIPVEWQRQDVEDVYEETYGPVRITIEPLTETPEAVCATCGGEGVVSCETGTPTDRWRSDASECHVCEGTGKPVENEQGCNVYSPGIPQSLDPPDLEGVLRELVYVNERMLNGFAGLCPMPPQSDVEAATVAARTALHQLPASPETESEIEHA